MLPPHLVTKCSRMPETAMGSQRVRLVMRNGEEVEAVLCNCEYVQSDIPVSGRDIVDVLPAHDYAYRTLPN